jgi:2-oxoglutarate dehydrogenase E2 component (dihydrolipoamide succinyltransferase)
MSFEIVVPELGESIVEATVACWLKQEGGRVEVGEAVVELETEKVNLEVSVEQAGVLARIARQEGEDVAMGDVLGVVEEAGEESLQAPDKEKADDKTQAEEKAKPVDKDNSLAKETSPEESTREEEKTAEKYDKKATPMAKRLAQEHGIDLAQVSPDDSDGRVTKKDVEYELKEQEAKADKEQQKKEKAEKKTSDEEQNSAKKQPIKSTDRTKREERVRMSRRRQTIARRLVEAQQTAAMLTTFNEVDMSQVIDLRRRRQESFQEQHGIKLGFMSFFVKAVVGALKQFPQLNAEIDGNEIVLKHYYDIGMAIGAEEGLVVPVIREADRLTFAEIEQTINDYVQKINEGVLSLEDLRGGTFTITNGGVFGSLLSTPILNPPQVGILGLHKIEKRPVVIDDEMVIRPMMYVALSYDHRIVDGRQAVQFLVRVKELIEDPEVLLLEG